MGHGDPSPSLGALHWSSGLHPQAPCPAFCGLQSALLSRIHPFTGHRLNIPQEGFEWEQELIAREMVPGEPWSGAGRNWQTG